MIRPSRGTHLIMPGATLPSWRRDRPGRRRPHDLRASVARTDADRHHGQRLRGRPRARAAGAGGCRLPARRGEHVLRDHAPDDGHRRRVRGRAAADLHRRSAQVGRHLAQGRALRDVQRHGHDHRRQADHVAADGQDDRRPDRRARGPRRPCGPTRCRWGCRSRRATCRACRACPTTPTTSCPRYGHAAHEVLRLAAERPELAAPVQAGMPDLLAEAAYAARREQARRSPTCCCGARGSASPRRASCAHRGRPRRAGWRRRSGPSSAGSPAHRA